MKKIFKYSFIVLAALVAMPTAMNAQKPGTGPEGVVFDKIVTKNNANSYTINIETYVTGATTEIITEYHTPVDVIFVLDFSSSMNKNMSGGYGGTTRLEALKSGVKAALEILGTDSKLKEGNHHRAGLIRFANNNDTGSKTLMGLTEVNATNYNDLYNNYLKNQTTGNDTYVEKGTGLALTMANGRSAADKKDRPLVVIIFTDGAPETVTGTNQAVKDKYDLIHTHKAKVYTIATAADVTNKKMIHYLNVLSSNYPDVSTASFTSGSGQIENWKIDDNNLKTTPDPNKYFKLVSSVSELVEIFSEITKDVTDTGKASYEKLTAESAANIDIVSNNFKLPDALISASDPSEYIHVQVAQVTGIDSDGKFTWGNAKAPEECGMSAVSIAIIDSNPDDGKDVKDGVQITGFDYSGNFVSEKKDGNGQSFNPKRVNGGYKLIISFDIALNPENPGGANEVTNDIKSGLYIKNEAGELEQIAWFQQPTVNNPNLIIVKEGLHKNESAVFTVHDEKGKMADMTVVATCTADGADSIVLIKVQDDGRYTVTENAWSWAYDKPSLSVTKEQTSDVLNENNSSITRDVNAITEDSETINGKKGTIFIFTNSLKNNNPAHGESFKNNEFSGHTEPNITK